MTDTESESIEQAVAIPEQAFSTPEEVLADRHLTKEEKIKILESWALDADEISRAEAENMTVKKPQEIPPAELLQRISRAKLELDKV